MRVHELAKELDIKSADIVKALGEKGIDVKAASSIDDDNIEFVKTKFKNSQKESSGEATEDEKKEKSKPRVIITSKGVIEEAKDILRVMEKRDAEDTVMVNIIIHQIRRKRVRKQRLLLKRRLSLR